MLQWRVMKLLVDFFPLLLFFAAYLWQGIYVATAVAIVASIAQIAWIHWKHGRAGVTHWLSLAIIVLPLLGMRAQAQETSSAACALDGGDP